MQYLDSAYELALDMSRSCYPTYADGLKTRADFDAHAARPFQRDNYTMLLYEEDDEALGLIQFYVWDDDRYVQPDIFCIKKNYGRAVREFVEYLRGLYPGYELHFGVSHTNKEAVEALELSDAVLGAPRMLEGVERWTRGKRREALYFGEAVVDWVKAHREYGRVAI